MPRRYDSADAKRRILTACVRFFLEKGYTRTTVAEIVKEADVSISTFQNVFRTKDGVLVELVKFMFGSQFDMAGQIAGQKLPPVYVYAVETSIQLALIEYWSIDPDYDGITFRSQWQDYRENTDNDSDPLHCIYTATLITPRKAERTVCVKAVDVFGFESMVTETIHS